MTFERCTDCPLAGVYVPGDGPRNAAVMAVGTAPGDAEELVEAPFAGPAGEIVRAAFSAVLGEDQVYYTNLLKRRPKGKRPTQQETHVCGKHLMNEIRWIRPSVIVTLGVYPTRFLTGSTSPLEHLRGLMISTKRFGHEFFVMPTYDPAYVLRRGGLSSPTGHEWLSDLEELVKL